MKCLVCGNEFDDTKEKNCPKCGFVALHVVGDLDSQSAEIQEIVKKYMEQRVEGMEVFMKLTSYPDGLELPPAISYEPMGILGKTITQKTVWMPHSFARVERPDVDITLGLKGVDGSIREITVNMPTPPGKGFWKLGVAYFGKTNLKLYIYGQDEMTESELINI